MAMLAERRDRKRYNLVPRGKALYEDDNRFGTRMLEKMGWSKGKGLGAKEDGAKEFVRIRYKNDNEGLGFEDRNDQWTQHEASFDGLLKSLNSGDGDDSMNTNKEEEEDEMQATRGFGFAKEEDAPKVSKIAISGESLEEKSKKSRARVHYMKFTRGKDISQYSEKDLANIFGKKSLLVEQKESVREEEQQSSNESSRKATDNEEEQASRFGVTTIQTGTSINDYFKSKLESVRDKSKYPFNSHTDEDKTEQQRTKLENKIYEATNPDEVAGKRKNLKKRRKSLVDENVVENLPSEEIAANEQLGEKPLKKKKRKGNLEKGDENEVNLNNLGDSTAATETSSKVHKKASQKEKISTLQEETSNINEYGGYATNEIENPGKKKKKSKRMANNEINLEVPVLEVSEEMILRNDSKKSKKKVDTAETPHETLCNNHDGVLLNEASSEIIEKLSKKSSTSNDLTRFCDVTSIAEKPHQKKKKKKIAKSDANESSTSEIVNISQEEAEQFNQMQKDRNKSNKGFNEESPNTCQIEGVDTITSENVENNKRNMSNKRKKPKQNNEENEPSSTNTVADPTNENTGYQSQKVSNPLSTASTSKDNAIRFPELKRRKSKKEKTQEVSTLESNETLDEKANEYEYKMSSYAAEKFSNVDISGFCGSNFDEIPGYGINGRIKIEIYKLDIDDFKIKNFYSRELAKIEEQKRKFKRKKRWAQKEETSFPRISLL